MIDSETIFKLPGLRGEKRQRLQYATRAIIERARACGNELERVKMLHDWLVRRCVYGKTPGNEEEAHNAYGALVVGRAVCSGIAEAFGYLCRQTFIECRFVVGYAGRAAKPPKDAADGNHAWNLVRVGGTWYHIDVTHDLNRSKQFIRYDYFLLSDAEAATSRTWHAPSHPPCPASFGYYRRLGLFAPDMTSLHVLLRNQAKQGASLLFQIPVFAESDEAAIESCLEQALRDALGKTGTRWKSLALRPNHKRGIYQVALQLEEESGPATRATRT